MNVILALGIIMITGVVGGKLVGYINFPSVTGYLVFGILVGPSLLNLVPKEMVSELAPVNDLALGIIAVSIGGELSWKRLKKSGKNLSKLFLSEAFLTFLLVTSISWFLSSSLPIALVLGVLSMATAPAAILAMIRDYRARGEFPSLLLSLVALDNLFCIISFGIVTTLLQMVYFEAAPLSLAMLGGVAGNMLLSIIIGVFLGFAISYLSSFSLPENKFLVIILGVILLGVGTGIALNLSSLLITMIMGLVMVNFSYQPQQIFALIGRIDTPILVTFLTMAGVKLDLGILSQIGLLGAAYIIARLAGKIIGAALGATFCRDMPKSYRRGIPMALTPQAGVAIGLSILVEQKLPLPEGLIVTLILSTVIIFELLGPLLVKRALEITDAI